MLNSPLATAWLVVQVTGRGSPWLRFKMPVGAVTVMALKTSFTSTVPGLMP